MTQEEESFSSEGPQPKDLEFQIAAKPEPEESSKEAESIKLLHLALEFERPKELSGKTYKVRLNDTSLYITINRSENSGQMLEVFATQGRAGTESKANSEALGRAISLFLQKGGNPKDMIATLKGISGGDVSFDEGETILSVPDAIAKIMEMNERQFKVGGTS